MKQIVFSLISLGFLFHLTAFSLDSVSGFGPKIGINFANVQGADIPNQAGTITGFIGGGYAEFILDENIYGQGELFYSQKGYNYEVMSQDFDIELEYFETDWLLKYKTQFDIFQPFVCGGIGLGLYLIDAEEAGKDIKKDMNLFDAGILIGGGFEIKRFSFEVRYNSGLTKIYREELNLKIKNKVVSIMTGFRL